MVYINMINLPLVFLTIVCAIVFGFLAVLIGIGGGLFYVPYLIFVLNLEAVSTLTSSFAILFTSTSGTIKYSKLKYIDYKIGLLFVLVAIPGSLVGSYVAEVIITDINVIKILFAYLIGGVAFIKLIQLNLLKNQKPVKLKNFSFWTMKRKVLTKDGAIFEYDVRVGFGVIFSFFGGFLAGILGVGGGLVFVPILSSLSGLPISIAIATSTFMIVIVSIFVLATRFVLFTGDFFTVLIWGLILGISSVIGGYIGASKVSKTDSKTLVSLFWGIALLAALRILIDTL